jgi:hypothetical protein
MATDKFPEQSSAAGATTDILEDTSHLTTLDVVCALKLMISIIHRKLTSDGNRHQRKMLNWSRGTRLD